MKKWNFKWMGLILVVILAVPVTHALRNLYLAPSDQMLHDFAIATLEARYSNDVDAIYELIHPKYRAYNQSLGLPSPEEMFMASATEYLQFNGIPPELISVKAIRTRGGDYPSVALPAKTSADVIQEMKKYLGPFHSIYNLINETSISTSTSHITREGNRLYYVNPDMSPYFMAVKKPVTP